MLTLIKSNGCPAATKHTPALQCFQYHFSLDISSITNLQIHQIKMLLTPNQLHICQCLMYIHWTILIHVRFFSSIVELMIFKIRIQILCVTRRKKPLLVRFFELNFFESVFFLFFTIFGAFYVILRQALRYWLKFVSNLLVVWWNNYFKLKMWNKTTGTKLTVQDQSKSDGVFQMPHPFSQP